MAYADEDNDLGLIPQEIVDEAESTSAARDAPLPAKAKSEPILQGKYFIEDAFTIPSARRAVHVPYPSNLLGWQNRSSLDVNLQLEPWHDLAITLANRLDVVEQEEVSFLSRQTVRNVFSEGYVTWEAAPNLFFEAGRINVRNGLALGFNPIDFFKTRTVVGQASLDPSLQRRHRLGTLMGRWHSLWSGGSASIAFAPKLYQASTINDVNPFGLDPRFHATNAAHRLLCSLSFEVADLSPQAFAYLELHRSKIGLSISRPLGDAVLVYAEWTGGPEANLATRSVMYGRAVGTLPSNASVIPPTDTSTKFRNDVATGASWTVAEKVTVNLEYHFHQAGFSQRDWRNWFDIGSSPTSDPGVIGELWHIRAYAFDQQEPVSKHQAFVRVAWPKTFIEDLELSGFAFVSLLDASTLAQISAYYYASQAWTIAAHGSGNFGSRRSERGSLPTLGSLVLQLVRYM